jgi:hypothetical protein
VRLVMAISPEDRKYFEEIGELYVRRAMQMTDRFPFPFEHSAREWLAELDETQRPMREARQTKLTRQSESKIRAAWITAFSGNWRDCGHDPRLDLSTALVARQG